MSTVGRGGELWQYLSFLPTVGSTQIACDTRHEAREERISNIRPIIVIKIPIRNTAATETSK